MFCGRSGDISEDIGGALCPLVYTMYNGNNNVISFLVRCQEQKYMPRRIRKEPWQLIWEQCRSNYRWQLSCMAWVYSIWSGLTVSWSYVPRAIYYVVEKSKECFMGRHTWILQSIRSRTSCRPILAAEGMQPEGLGLGSGICLSPERRAKVIILKDVPLPRFWFLNVYPEHFKHLNF